MTVAHSHGATHGPSVGRQVVRAAVATLSALAVLGLVAVGIADAGRIHELWYHVAGDPAVRLADGVTLSTSARDVAVPVLQPTAWSAAESSARLADVTGEPVRRISVAQARTALGEDSVAAGATTQEAFSTPLGVVVVNESDTTVSGPQTGSILLVAPRTGPRLGAAQQQALMRLMAVRWALQSTAASPDFGVRVEQVGSPSTLAAALVVGDVALDPGSAGWAQFDGQGRLLSAHILVQRIVGVTTMHVMSPAAAFDAVRHHAEGTQAPGSPVVGVELDAEQTQSPDQPSMVYDFLTTPGTRRISVNDDGIAPAS